jgi:ElaB/YqjD/DUF883 family membrane-anchored ribosome-binding protein
MESERSLDPVDANGKVRFHNNLSATLESNFDLAEAKARTTGTREDKVGQQAHNEQLFRMRTKKVLVASERRTVESDANIRLVAKTLDGVLQHNNFMSEKARGQAKSNVIFATLLHEQKNSIKTLSDSVARLGRDYRSLNDRVDQSHTTLDGKITDVHNEVNNINDNINSMKSESAATAAAALQMDKLMAFMMHDKTLSAAAPAVPVSTPAQLQSQSDSVSIIGVTSGTIDGSRPRSNFSH